MKFANKADFILWYAQHMRYCNCNESGDTTLNDKCVCKNAILFILIRVDLIPEIYMNSIAHSTTTTYSNATLCASCMTSCTDMNVPFAYLGWGQGLSPRHQLGVATHTEKGRD